MKFFTALVYALVLALPVASRAETTLPEAFSHYRAYELVDNRLYLAPDLAKSAKVIGPSSGEESQSPVVTLPFDGTILSISYDPGPSDDPTFVLHFKDTFEYLSGDTLYISADGFFYLVQRSDASYEKKRKFQLSNGKLKEILQPFYLVDQVCETTASLFMYDNKCNTGNLIARLPQGATVKILLIEKEPARCTLDVLPGTPAHGAVSNYLVATPFGLVGWVASSMGDLSHPGKPLGCIRFQGD